MKTFVVACLVGLALATAPSVSPSVSPTGSPTSATPSATPTVATWIVSPKVDQALESIPDEIWAIIAVVACVFGVVLALSGRRLLRTAGFVVGFLLGGFSASFVFAQIPQAPASAYLSVVLIVAVFGGLIGLRLKSLLRTTAGIALGVVLAAILMQYGIGDAVESKYATYAIFAAVVLVCGYAGYVAYQQTLVVLTSVLGGLFVMSGVSYFSAPETGVLSVYGLFADPKSLKRCSDVKCHLGFILGSVTVIVGMTFQWCVLGASSKKLNNAQKRRQAQERARREQEKRFAKELRDIKAAASEERVRAERAHREEIERLKQEKRALMEKRSSFRAQDVRLLEIESAMVAATSRHADDAVSEERSKLAAQQEEATVMRDEFERTALTKSTEAEELKYEIQRRDVEGTLTENDRKEMWEKVFQTEREESLAWENLGKAEGVLQALRFEILAITSENFNLATTRLDDNVVLDVEDEFAADTSAMTLWDKFDHYCLLGWLFIKSKWVKFKEWTRDEMILAKAEAQDIATRSRERRLERKKVELGAFSGEAWSERYAKAHGR